MGEHPRSGVDNARRGGGGTSTGEGGRGADGRSARGGTSSGAVVRDFWNCSEMVGREIRGGGG